MTTQPIAIVTPWFGRDLKGGAEQQAWQIATRLAERGHSVEVLTTCCRSFFEDWSQNHFEAGATVESGVTVRRFPVTPRNRAAFDDLNRELLSIPPERLSPGQTPTTGDRSEIWTRENINSLSLEAFLTTHGQDYRGFVFLPYLYGIVLRGLPLVADRAWLQPCLHNEAYAYLPAVADVFRKARGLLFNSAGELQLAANLYGPMVFGKGTVVGEGVEFAPLAEDRIRDIPRAVDGHRFLLCLGRREHGKNTDLLVSAFRSFYRSRDTDMCLVLAGPGESNYGATNEGVIDLGLVTEAERVSLLQSCLALCQPSTNESFSRVLFEAWECGKPALVHTDCLATAIAVERSGGGWTAGTPSEWISQICQIDSSGAQHLAIVGAKGRIYAEQMANWENVIRRYELLFGMYETVGKKNTAPLRIAIDLQSCQTDSRDRGIGRYSFNLMEALSKALQNGEELIVCVDTADTHRLRDVRNALRRTGIAGGCVVAYGYPHTSHSDSSATIQMAAGQLRAKFFESISPDLVLITSLFELGGCYSTALDWDLLKGLPTAAIAYDLIPLLFPDKYLPQRQLRTDRYLEKVAQLNQFDLLFAISDTTRRDLTEVLGIHPDKIKVVGAGLDRSVLRNSDDEGTTELSHLGIRKPFVLMVGNGDWRKNSIGALEAFADLPKELRGRHQLVLTQPGNDVREKLQAEHRNLKDSVVILGKVSEKALALLYSKCRVFFFPSLYEGFGLPVLEAMAHGAPTLSSCLGSLPEVVHTQDILFDPRDREMATAMLRRALEDDQFCESIRANSKEHAASFTWERCARAVIEEIRNYPRRCEVLARTVWPTEHEIGVFASACEDAGDDGAEQLEDGLRMIANKGRRRILVDITEVVRLEGQTGIQRVTRNYCVGLAEIGAIRGFEVEPIVWTESGVRLARDYARRRLGMKCNGEDGELVSRPNDLVFMLDSSWWSPQRFDDLHSQTWRMGGEVIWMVHDLIPIEHPRACAPGMPQVFEEWLNHAVLSADGFICNSEATRAALERFMDAKLSLSLRRPWTRKIHLGCDFAVKRSLLQPSDKSSSILSSIGRRPFFVTLGTLEPRKDIDTVLDAFEQLWTRSEDLALVLIGNEGWNVEKLTKRIRQNQDNGRPLFWLQGASDGDVKQLLKNTTALIQASFAEGFGLPIIEAGSLGVRLLLSDIPVFREIARDEAVYFPVGQSASLVSAIRRTLNGNVQSPRTIQAMTWQESTEKLSYLLL